MKLLLDTHTFLWWDNPDPRLPARVKMRLTDPGNQLFLSVVSIWEIAIKVQLRKLHLPEKLEPYFVNRLAAYRIDVLQLTLEHIYDTVALTSHHRDPFDRLLIAQARRERLPILTNDGHFAKYPVQVLW